MAPPTTFRPNYGVTAITQCDPDTGKCVFNGSLDFTIAGSFEQLFAVDNEFWKYANLLVALEAGFGDNLETGPVLGPNFDYVGFDTANYLHRFEAGVGYTNDSFDLKLGLFNPTRYLFPSVTSGDEINRFLGTAAIRPLAWNWTTSLVIPMIGAKYAFTPNIDLSAVTGFDAFSDDHAFTVGSRLAGHWLVGEDYEGTAAAIVNYRMGTSTDNEDSLYTPVGGTAIGLQLEQKFTKYAQLAFSLGYMFNTNENADQLSLSTHFVSQFWEDPDLRMNLILGFAHTYFLDKAEDSKIHNEELYLKWAFLTNFAVTANLQLEQSDGADDVVIPGLRATAYW